MAHEFADDLFKALEHTNNLLIVIKGSPDPDVLASSFALKVICESRNIQATIVSLLEVSLPQNKALILKLDIPVHFVKKIYSPDEFDGYAVLDYQSAWIEDIGTKIPCLIHIDHHAPEEDRISPAFRYISEEVGAVSTLLAQLYEQTAPNIEPASLSRVATALYYGIKIDTDDFQHATEADTESIAWLKNHTDARILSEMESIPYSEETITVISKAVMNGYYYKDWLFCGVGYISERYRDSIALAADYMLQNEDLFAVAVFALIERKGSDGLYLDTSIRASEESFDLNRFIKFVAPEGGARSFKGAFQVNLDYFNAAPDKQLLWELVRNTTIANLVAARDHFPAITFETLFSKFKRKFRKLFEF
ncbi:MAG TPA: hypothetical protein VF857_00235 [Spirochaetota bacterium]